MEIAVTAKLVWEGVMGTMKDQRHRDGTHLVRHFLALTASGGIDALHC